MPAQPSILQHWRLPELARLGSDQANAVRNAALPAAIGNFLNASVILAGLLPQVPWQPLLTWYALICALCGHALLRRRGAQDTVPFHATPARIRRAVFSAFAFGLPWGMLGAVCLGTLPNHNELVLVTVLAGMAGGGSIYLAPMFPAAAAYLIAVLMPIVIKAFLLQDAGYTLFGMLALSYGGFLWSVICLSARHHLERSETHATLRDQTILLQAIVDHFPGGITFLDSAMRVVLCNGLARRMHGWPEADPGTTGHHIEDLILPREMNSPEARCIETELERVRGRQSFTLEREQRGTILDIRGTPVAGGGFLTTYFDITERRRSEYAILHMAKHDALTNLPNRFVFLERLERTISGSRNGDRGLALLAVDLDRFKEINDTLGHPVGDRLLVEVASRLKGCIRDGDLVARLGGDEFCILQTVMDPMRDSAALAERILGMFKTPIDLGVHTVSVNVSLGVALAPEDASCADELTRKADLALLAAKCGGRNQFRYFKSEMDAALRRRRIIEIGLRAAIENSELELQYQPILHVASGAINGFEALLRWNSRELGKVAPADFISIAEETGLIVEIGRWVVKEACRQAATWPAPLRVAVNLSPLQFADPHLVDVVCGAAQSAGLAPQRLEVEVTETAMLSEAKGMFATLDQLREQGIRIVLDDFGTGYSSIANLKRFPFDKIKIDRTFVVDLKQADPFGLTFVRMIAELGARLGVATTAEGVETSEQQEIVASAGCSEIQGFKISQPLPTDKIRAFLEHQREDSPVAA